MAGAKDGLPCIVVASASGIGGAAGSPEAQAGLNIVRFTDGSTQGESLAFQVTRRGEPLALRKSVEVTAGDTLAFVFHATAYQYAAYIETLFESLWVHSTRRKHPTRRRLSVAANIESPCSRLSTSHKKGTFVLR